MRKSLGKDAKPKRKTPSTRVLASHPSYLSMHDFIGFVICGAEGWREGSFFHLSSFTPRSRIQGCSCVGNGPGNDLFDRH